MITDTLLKSMMLDLSICQHLHAKFDPAMKDWRPRENMRSTIELMQYLCYNPKTLAAHYVSPAVNAETAREHYRAQAKWASAAVTFENFPEMIERAKEEIQASLSGIDDADLGRITYHPFGERQMTLFEALLTVERYLTAYRHQLFLYAKMCGAEISTPNNWYGRDPQPAPVKKAVA